MSAAVATRRPVEMRSWVCVSAEFVAVSDRNAVIAAMLVLMLAIGVCPWGYSKTRAVGHTGLPARQLGIMPLGPEMRTQPVVA